MDKILLLEERRALVDPGNRDLLAASHGPGGLDLLDVLDDRMDLERATLLYPRSHSVKCDEKGYVMSDLTFRHIPECPLCLKQMREIITRKGTIYACLGPDCMISISKNDPAVNKWRECAERMPPCPRCGTIMRAFFRALDGYKKVQCPKCKAQGRITQVEVGKVSDVAPNAGAWNVDPKELE